MRASGEPKPSEPDEAGAAELVRVAVPPQVDQGRAPRARPGNVARQPKASRRSDAVDAARFEIGAVPIDSAAGAGIAPAEGPALAGSAPGTDPADSGDEERSGSPARSNGAERDSVAGVLSRIRTLVSATQALVVAAGRTAARSGPPADRGARAPAGSPRGLGTLVLPGIAIVASVALLAAALVKTHLDGATVAAEAAAFRPPAMSDPGSAPHKPVIVVVGDAARGDGTEETWQILLGERMHAGVAQLCGTGTGYASDGQDGRSLVDCAEEVPASATAVVFIGGAADAAVSPLSLARDATTAFAAARTRAPHATLLVVGPLFRPAGVTPTDLATVRSTLRASAGIANARFLDPVGRAWLKDGPMVLADLTARDERSIAKQLGAALAPALR